MCHDVWTSYPGLPEASLHSLIFARELSPSVAGARVKAVKVMPKLWIVRVEVAKVAQQIGLSQNYGTNYTLLCGLACVWVKPVKNSTVYRTFTKFWHVRGWTQ